MFQLVMIGVKTIILNNTNDNLKDISELLKNISDKKVIQIEITVKDVDQKETVKKETNTIKATP